MHLPVLVMISGRQVDAITVNISHNGVLLRVPDEMLAEAEFEFFLEVPKEVTLDGSTAAIHCIGHVIRSYQENGSCYVAAAIDDYRFQ